MNFVILGDGPEERAWVDYLAGRGRDPGHRLVSAFPGFPILEVDRARDLDDALARAGVDAAVVGGDPVFRSEALRRAAAEGLAVICLHPPGDDSEAYYQVALSRDETGAVIVPDLAARLHPGVDALRAALTSNDVGAFRVLRVEAVASDDLARHAFARAADLVRALIGEVEAVTATGDPPGVHPRESLVVQLRGPNARRAEVRLTPGPPEPTRVSLTGADGSLTLELPADLDGPGRLVRRVGGGETVETLEPWDRHAAILGVLAEAVARRPSHPSLHDGTRATEVAEGAVRSLKRGRTVELHYEEISEAGTFKSVMTSSGCVILLSVLVVLPIALGGPAIGMNWTIYLAYLIPPALVLFLLLQSFRLVARGSRGDVVD